MIAFLKAIERHHDLVDLFIKTVGVVATLGGAAFVVIKHFADRKADRQKAELDLRRQAYFDYFTGIHLQLADLGAFYNDQRVPAVPAEAFKALHRLHLLAGSAALACLIERTQIYAKGVLELSELKRTAEQLDAASEHDARMAESAARAWETFRERFPLLIGELNRNYCRLVILAREEIGLRTDCAGLASALEREAELAAKLLARYVPAEPRPRS